MRLIKPSLCALIVLTGLATSSASAQQFGVGGARGNAFGGAGFGNGFNSGFNNFGGGGYTNFGGFNNGYGGIGYNRGYNYNAYPQTYNNMGGLMNSIRTQTGRGNSYRYGSGPAVGGRRR